MVIPIPVPMLVPVPPGTMAQALAMVDWEVQTVVRVRPTHVIITVDQVED